MNSRFIRTLCILAIVAFIATPAFAQGIFDKSVDWPQIGSFKASGSASVSGGVYNIKGNGRDIWEPQDEAYFIYTEKSGSNSLSAKLHWLSPGGSEWAKVGPMIRNDAVAPGSVHFNAILRSGLDQTGDQSYTQWRPVADAGTSNAQITDGDGNSIGDGVYLRISRSASNNVFFSEWSTDGTNWNLGHVRELNMSETVAYGLAITNHNDDEILAEAEVSDVVLSESIASVALRTIPGEPVFVGVDSRTISLLVAGSGSVTVTETPPAGWSVSDISDGGTLSGGTITWNLPAAKTVTYVATSSAGLTADAVFSGSTSDYPTQGSSTINAPEPVGEFENHLDIGPVGAAGSAEFADDTYTVTGSGADIWGTADQFHYVYKKMSGAFMIEGNLFGFNDGSSSDWSKFGFMVRDELTAGSKHIFSMVRGLDLQFETQMRTGTDGSSTGTGLKSNQTGDARLVRTGDNFETYFFDPETNEWVLDASVKIVMADPVNLGLAVTSHENPNFALGEFTNVTITELPFAVYKTFAATELNPGAFFDIVVRIDPSEGSSPNINVTESYPSAVNVSSINASAGEATDDGSGNVTWSLTGASDEATLTISFEVPADVTGGFVDFSGSFDDGSGYSGSTGSSSVLIQTLSDLGIFQGNEDIGGPAAAGNVLFDGETWTVVGSGADIWDSADHFHFLWTRVEGDFVFSVDDPYIGPFGSTPSSNDWQKMGIMARQDLSAGSAYVINNLRVSDQAYMQQWRDAANTGAAWTDATTPPGEWNLNWDPAADGINRPNLEDVTLGGTIVMAREGDFFTLEYLDANGERIYLQDHELAMTDPIYLGIAVTSHEDGSLSRGIFKNPKLEGTTVAVKAWMLY